MSSSSVFQLRLKLLRSSADPELYKSEFQTEGALTLNAFTDSASVIRGTAVGKNLCHDRNHHHHQVIWIKPNTNAKAM